MNVFMITGIIAGTVTAICLAIVFLWINDIELVFSGDRNSRWMTIGGILRRTTPPGFVRIALWDGYPMHIFLSHVKMKRQR